MQPVKKCGVCAGSDSLEPVKDKRNNGGYLCSGCSDHAKWLADDSPYNFFLCTGCGLRILAGSPMDRQSRCDHCGADLDVHYANLDEDQPIGDLVLIWDK
jgi:DNA-directed RNA polymerase subunit RPC12/RpoP